MKPVMVLPPSPFALKVTLTLPIPGVAVPIVGAAGTVDGVTEPVAADSGESPFALVACTVQVTVTPFGTITEIGEPPPPWVKGPPVPLQVAV